MIDNAVLRMCREAILSHIGTLSDLPPELAVAIGNYYYKFYSVYSELQKGKIPGVISSENDIITDFEKFADDAEKRLQMIKVLPQSIEALRDIDKEQQPNLYRAFLNLLLDIYKYEIENAGSKNGIRRMMERKFKIVNEIPNILKLLKL